MEEDWILTLAVPWTGMLESTSAHNLPQTSSWRLAFIVRKKRHWFLISAMSSFCCSSAISCASGPVLVSTDPWKFSHVYAPLLSLAGWNVRRTVSMWIVDPACVAIPQASALSQPTTRRISPFWASHPQIWFRYLYQLSRCLVMYFRKWRVVIKSSEYAPCGIVNTAPSAADDSKVRPWDLKQRYWSGEVEPWKKRLTHEDTSLWREIWMDSLAR